MVEKDDKRTETLRINLLNNSAAESGEVHAKIESEKQTLTRMIKIYCRKKHRSKALCDDCQALLGYSLNRLDHCRYGENKGFCNHCTTHCYSKVKREEIQRIMRFCGPRMICYDPIMAIRHLFRLKSN